MNIYKIVIGIFALTLVSFSVNAQIEKQYRGKYVTKKGWAKTFETARMELGDSPRQQGRYRIVLVKEDWHALSLEEKATTHRRITISGVITGTVSLQTGKASHVLVNKSRTGVIYSADDTLIPEAGDFFCSQGVPLTGVEEIKVTEGSGDFANLTGGSIFVEGVVNMCVGDSDYRKNTFTIIPGAGYLEFN
ncbi:hypothetical protein [Thalassotalea fusca]